MTGNLQHFQIHFWAKIIIVIFSYIKISLKFVPKGPIENKAAPVQITALSSTGDSSCTNGNPVIHHHIMCLSKFMSHFFMPS